MNADPKPSASKETVYVDVEDEITSIIDKVEQSKSKLVALVLPKRAATLQSVVNMRLLKRSADNAGKNVVLITSEAALLPLAGAAGLHVAKNLQSKPLIPPSPIEAEGAEEIVTAPISSAATPIAVADADEDLDNQPAKIDYNRSIGELAAAAQTDEAEVIALGDEDDLPEPIAPKSSAPKQAKAAKTAKVPNFDRFRLLLFGGIAALILLVIFIYLAIFVLPKATIAIQTSSTPLSANLNLSASDKFTRLNEAAQEIPASLKATNQTSQQQVTATGQQNQGNKASGSVKLSNCSNSAVTIPAGTGVSSGSLTYISQTSISLDSGNFTSAGACKTSGSHIGSVNVLAQKGGSNYNLPAGSNFTVAGYSSVTGTNPSALSGGTDNNVTVVSQSDIDNAKAKATSASSGSYSNNFLQQLTSSGYYVLKSTLKTSDPTVTASPDVGQPASTTTVSIQVTYSVMVLRKADLTKAITDALNKQIDSTRQKLATDNVLDGATVNVQNQTADAAAELNINESTTAVPIVSIASVKQLAAGKKSGDIQQEISNWPGIKAVNVKFSPFWVSNAPKKQNKISVSLTQVKS